jgi:hypothetical protein
MHRCTPPNSGTAASWKIHEEKRSDESIAAIEDRQSHLREKAFKIGAKLYDAQPERFRTRLDRYWRRARER